MAKANSILIKLVSSAGTGFYYTTRKNPRSQTEKLSLRKFDPVARKHVVFKEIEDQVEPAGFCMTSGLHRRRAGGALAVAAGLLLSLALLHVSATVRLTCRPAGGRTLPAITILRSANGSRLPRPATIRRHMRSAWPIRSRASPQRRCPGTSRRPAPG